MNVGNRTPQIQKWHRIRKKSLSPWNSFLMDYFLAILDFWPTFLLSRLGRWALCTRRWCCTMLSFRGKPFSPFLWQLGCGHSYSFLSGNSGIIGVEWPELVMNAGLACTNSGDGVPGPCCASRRCLCRLFFVLYVFEHTVQVKDRAWKIAGDGCTEALCIAGDENALGIMLLGVGGLQVGLLALELGDY